ncbi:ABC transporter related protein [Geobacter metallireducens RCH3]|uniref:Branched-chain amino acid ABC transporter, ATP-binding protein n=1 Tax=Geobacter metallireducens (strain ATCC 53774 / DSM 7210 / GS-15) TaxID=269799 RepID=Q39UM5_GEOMG|nr:ABC transporter ATP-binding protein [Geobacter metallireducens]ABB32049.1 branched-chain amino acid ABC transporter, ATP-binding protein [Geobacter metallireducens GS-15]EHP88763.1 ABC transporter related protein [Geobacter metallireducens RCH3]
MLEVQGITQRFGGVTALEDVSFRVADGAITGIIGPNGAGKTTLFNIVTGIYTPTCGTVHLQGKNVTRFTPERLASLGMVRTFQNIELFGRMTVLENVMVGLHTKGKSGIIASSLRLPWQVAEERRFRERALHWLEFTGITDLADHEAGSLPFGKGRLLEIARAMALEPKVILMDEPAAGLNSRETLELARLIQKIRESGVTVALVEHDMELVMDICDAIVVLNLGRKLAQGTPREIQENPEVISAYLGEG